MKQGRRWKPKVVDVEAEKICRDCHTRTTPLWRAGPDGPRSLCNACGLRFRKGMALRGLSSAVPQKRKKRTPNGRVMKQRMPIGRQMKLREEEEAAISLMALSCGSTYPPERH
ncbi:GATA transcription factor 16-like [Neltuma alba]|uniref:GATA transcription factor 16-like n=1 Tax=Neltuma alba TaxID=207710 RepID=UPI0010A4D034|nr:GATA transcription factor 16-like [Prosopis alba]XP_028794693.1 GATA transcription factor 16-like [Prosopis alba]